MSHETEKHPWESLPRLRKRDVARVRRLRRSLGQALDARVLAEALGSLVARDVAIVVRDVGPASAGPRPEHAVFAIAVDSGIRIALEPEAALTSALLSSVLDRPVQLVDPSAPLAAPLDGALAAIVFETARRGGLELRVDEARAIEDRGGCGEPQRRATTEPLSLDDATFVRATVCLDGRPYGVSVWTTDGTRSAAGVDRQPQLDRLAELPLSAPIVAAASIAAPAELRGLSIGDVWIPGDGWFARSGAREAPRGLRDVAKATVLAAPLGRHGVTVGGSDDEKIVLLGNIVELAPDENPDGGVVTNMSENPDGLNSVLLDAPIVVRVEIGSVTMTAREWAALGPGDVLETGVRIAEPVVLRVAGTEVARGELVNVDGELGVRIRELLGRSP